MDTKLKKTFNYVITIPKEIGHYDNNNNKIGNGAEYKRILIEQKIIKWKERSNNRAKWEMYIKEAKGRIGLYCHLRKEEEEEEEGGGGGGEEEARGGEGEEKEKKKQEEEEEEEEKQEEEKQEEEKEKKTKKKQEKEEEEKKKKKKVSVRGKNTVKLRIDLINLLSRNMPGEAEEEQCGF
jgi:hypothetical protein